MRSSIPRALFGFVLVLPLLVTILVLAGRLLGCRCRVGALVVSADGRSVDGIVSERDVVRALHERGAGLLADPVSSVMTAQVHTCVPTAGVEELARTMTEHRVRHVPVVEDGALVGIVSIGDVVKARLDELEEERAQLVDYIQTG